MENKFNEMDLRRFYRMLSHEKETEIRLIHPTAKNVRSVFVRSEDEFVKVCRENNEQYNIYAGINERKSGGKDSKDVKTVSMLYLDIDPVRGPLNPEEETMGADLQKRPSTDKELGGAEAGSTRRIRRKTICRKLFRDTHASTAEKRWAKSTVPHPISTPTSGSPSGLRSRLGGVLLAVLWT